jgi:Transglycosylase-like domain
VKTRQLMAVGGACVAAVAAPAAVALAAGADDPTPVRAGARLAPLGALSAAERDRHAHARADASADVARLIRRVARLRDRRPSARALRAASRLTTPQLLRERRALRRQVRRLRTAARAAAVPPVLEAIAACESGGDPHAIGGGGAFRGKYQFDLGTWRAVGGRGDPAAAPEAEQDRRAALLYARSGAAPWPVCGR